jgi:hypothetical protein
LFGGGVPQVGQNGERSSPVATTTEGVGQLRGHHRPRVREGLRLPQCRDRFLVLPQLQAGEPLRPEFRQLLEPQAEPSRSVVEAVTTGEPDRLGGDPISQSAGLVEVENPTTTALRIEPVGETAFDPCALVEKRQGLDGRWNAVWYAIGILVRLQLDPGERHPLSLSLDHPNRFAVDEEEIVRRPPLERVFPDGDAPSGVQIHCSEVPGPPSRLP